MKKRGKERGKGHRDKVRRGKRLGSGEETKRQEKGKWERRKGRGRKK